MMRNVEVFAYIPKLLPADFFPSFRTKKDGISCRLLWVLCAWSVDFRPKRIL